MRKLLLYLFLCSVNLQLISQNEESMPDVSAENWLAGSFTYSINNKWKISFQEQVRFKYTVNPLDRVLTQIELENSSKNKKENFQFDWGLAFRHYYKSNQDETSLTFNQLTRFHYFTSYHWKFNRFEYEQRIQFQKRRERFPDTNKHVGEVRKYWRLKSSFAYNIKNWKLDPKLGVEFFLRSFDHPGGQHNKYRISLGTKKKLSKNHYLVFKYMFEKEYKSWNPNVVHMLSIKYNFKKVNYTKKFKEELDH